MTLAEWHATLLTEIADLREHALALPEPEPVPVPPPPTDPPSLPPDIISWTPAELIEVRKLVASALAIQAAIRGVGGQMGAQPVGAVKEAIYSVLVSLSDLSMRTRKIIQILAGTGLTTPPIEPRSAAIAHMAEHIALIGSDRNVIVNRLDALDWTAVADPLRALPTDTFDATLAYANPRPPSYPNVVGPHGDWEGAIQSIHHTIDYAQRVQRHAIAMWRTTSGFSSLMGQVMEHSALAIGKMFRVFGMNMDATLADDQQTILRDTEAGTGLRPPVFFRLLLEIEYLYGEGTIIFSGRNSKLGATADLKQAMIHMTRYLQSLPTAEERAEVWAPGGGPGSSTGGAAARFFFDFGDFWRTFDVWGADVMLFFREIPAPPSR